MQALPLWPALGLAASLLASPAHAVASHAADDATDSLLAGFYFVSKATVVDPGKFPIEMLNGLVEEFEQCGISVTGPLCVDSAFAMQGDISISQIGGATTISTLIGTLDGAHNFSLEFVSQPDGKPATWKSIRVRSPNDQVTILEATPVPGKPWDFIRKRAASLTSARELAQWIQYALWRRGLPEPIAAGEAPLEKQAADETIAALLKRYPRIKASDASDDSSSEDLRLNQLVMDLRADAQSGQAAAKPTPEFMSVLPVGTVTLAQLNAIRAEIGKGKVSAVSRMRIKRGASSADPAIQKAAALLVGSIKPTAQEAAAFIGLLFLDDNGIAYAVYPALHAAGPLPDAVLPKLEELIRKPNRVAYAASLLSQIANPRAEAALLAALKDPAIENQRAQIVEMISARKDSKYADLLFSLVADPNDYVAMYAWRGLVSLTLNDTHLPAIEKLSTTRYAKQIPELLARVATPAGTQKLVQLAGDPLASNDARVRAIAALGTTKNAQHVPFYLTTLETADESLAAAAYQALILVKVDDAYIPRIEAMVTGKRGSWVAGLLEKIATPSAFDALARLAQDTRDHGRQERAMRSLGAAKNLKYLNLFINALSAPQDYLYSEAWASLAQLPLTDSELPTILKLVDHKYGANLPTLLKVINTPASLQIVADLASGARPVPEKARDIVANALDVLKYLKDPQYLPIFLKALTSTRYYERAHAWYGLSENFAALNDSHLPTLVNYANTSEDYPEYAPAVIAKIGTPAAMQAVAGLVTGSPKKGVRQSAYLTLTPANYPGYKAVTLAALTTPDWRLASYAYNAVVKMTLDDADIPALRKLKGAEHTDSYRVSLVTQRFTAQTAASRAYLVEIASDTTDRRRQDALNALGTLGTCDELGALRALGTQTGLSKDLRAAVEAVIQQIQTRAKSCP